MLGPAVVLSVREAEVLDLPAILAITNQAIDHTTAIWTLNPTDLSARRAWLDERQGKGFPVLVGEVDGIVSGFASLGPFRPYEGYLHTAEDSLYVDPSAQGKGLGKLLLATLLERATAMKLHVVVAAIEAANDASIALHTKAGYQRVGLMPQVGRKFDRWLDLVLMQKIL